MVVVVNFTVSSLVYRISRGNCGIVTELELTPVSIIVTDGTLVLPLWEKR